jgi:acetyl-CoA C-acetyltransferase/acetyl-CoA acyltransferase
MIAGGVESISRHPGRAPQRPTDMDPWLVEHKPELYMAMIETADIVAKRYGITREDQDRFSCSQPAQDRRGPGRRIASGRDHRLHHHACGQEQGHRRSHLREVTVEAGQLQPPSTTLRRWPSWPR